MSDLETALRAKLEDMWNNLLPEDYGHEIIQELDRWLDARPDSWHDLRDNTEDLPDEHRKVLLVLGDGEKRWIGREESYYLGTSHWRNHRHEVILGAIYAWKYMVIEEFSNRFASKEKV